MALADLMKKGFLTSATLTVATVATLEPKCGRTVATVATVAVANPLNLKKVHSAGTMALPEITRGFMDEDGLTMAEARALAEVSVQPRPADEWLAMIAELDALITIFCAAEVWMTEQAKTAIWSTRCTQSLASIPETLTWFRSEVARMTRATPAQARYRNLSRSVGARSEKLAMNWPEPMAVHQPITKDSTQ
jgi:hypothetical protein